MKTNAKRSVLFLVAVFSMLSTHAYAQYSNQIVYQNQWQNHNGTAGVIVGGQYQYNQPQAQYQNRVRNYYHSPTHNRPNYHQPANLNYSSQPQTQTHSTTSQSPNYVVPIADAGGSRNFQGSTYDTHAGIGLDQRSGFTTGGSYGTDGRFLGAQAQAGAGLYADAGASQTTRIGNGQIVNSVQGSGFIGTEAAAEAGIRDNQATLGASAFTGARAGGTARTDIGVVGVGASGEAWAGSGAEAGVNVGIKDRKLNFGGKVGIGLGVGGKVGVNGSLDYGKALDFGQETGQNVGQWGQRTGRDVQQFTQGASRNVQQFGRNTGNNVKDFSQKATGNVQQFGRNTGNNVKSGAKKFGNSTKKFGRKIGGMFKK